jgi:hypothetical protein
MSLFQRSLLSVFTAGLLLLPSMVLAADDDLGDLEFDEEDEGEEEDVDDEVDDEEIYKEYKDELRGEGPSEEIDAWNRYLEVYTKSLYRLEIEKRIKALEEAAYQETLEERLAEGHDISEEERALMQRALDENSVIVAQMTPFFDKV